MLLKEILKEWVVRHTSDIIISSNNYPSYKIDWEIEFQTERWILDKDLIKKEFYDLLNEAQIKTFEKELELDFSITIWEKNRFRVNAFNQRDWITTVYRVIKPDIPEFRWLWLPSTILNLVNKKSWLVLITGSVWSWKSTTMAALINHINNNQTKHIISIEDPIEFIFKSDKSLVEQREVWTSTLSFGNGLKYALRQAPDVIMVWEMRDLESFRLALRAAETGNLVFATLHTSWAAKTISRVIDMFPWDEKGQIRAQLAESLVWVVWQELVKKNGWWRVVLPEILINTTSISNMIRENKIHQIDSAIETWQKDWMLPMKKSLDYLFSKGIILKETLESSALKLLWDDR